MKKQQIRERFYQIRAEYNSIPSPKYKNIKPSYLQDILTELVEYKWVLKSDPTYTRLINSISQTVSKLNSFVRREEHNYSERSMNKVIHPFPKKCNVAAEFPIKWIRWNTECYLTNGYWGSDNYMVLDVAGYAYLIDAGNGKLPTEANPIFEDMNSITDRESQFLLLPSTNIDNEASVGKDLEKVRADGVRGVTFDDRYFRRFTGKQMSSNAILQLLLETSRVEFKLTYPVITRTSKGKETRHIMNAFSRFFEFEYTNDDVRKDGIIRNRRYRIYFSTFLGELFINNLKARYNDKINVSFYSLPESAQLFYRRFLLHNSYDGNISLSDIISGIGLKDNNRTNLIRTIDNSILDTLVQFKFIETYTKKEGLQDIIYMIKKCPNK